MASPSPYPPTNIYMQSLIKPVLMVSRMVENVSLDKNDASPAINHFSEENNFISYKTHFKN